jgi:hypothetical protein
MFCRWLFFLLYIFLLAIVLSVLRYTDSDCPFDIFNLFLVKSCDLNIELLTISSASNTNPTNDWGEFRCSRRTCGSSSTSGTRRVNLVANPIIRREYGKDPEVLPTNGTYRWSLWHRYCITVNHVVVATVTFSKWWLQFYQRELLFQ